MKDITAQSLRHSLSKRYSGAAVYVLDAEYELPTKAMIETAYSKFQKSLWKYGVFKWLQNKWDCDKFAWAFKASVSLGNALSKNNNAQPVGFLCYHIDGDVTKGHAINLAAYETKDGFIVREIEPQPRGGIKSLTQAERDSAWLIVV